MKNPETILEPSSRNSAEKDAEETTIESSLKQLEQKAEITSACYLYSIRKIETKSALVFIIALVSSIGCSAISLFTQMNLVDNHVVSNVSLIIAFLSLALAIFASSDRIFGWNTQLSEFKFAYRVLRAYIRESAWVRDNRLPKLDQADDMELEGRVLLQKYTSLTSSLPPSNISDREFLEVKQNLLLKIKGSKMLDKDPEADLDFIKTKMR